MINDAVKSLIKTNQDDSITETDLDTPIFTFIDSELSFDQLDN